MLIGSSLGGYRAAVFAACEPDSAPAVAVMAARFDFAGRPCEGLGKDLDRWIRYGCGSLYDYRREGRELAFGRASGRVLRGRGRVRCESDVKVAVKVLHGVRDRVVDPMLSIEFANCRPNV